ncbi:hypothetical protein GOBAR_AA34836 [Gossypium barbadense]|uniref:Uncharacterized protein n=1 Tax=Gossypium barbadense TaxID=3634 RepID=A0A2P5W462_GOSBA|nr:hypothetical protein GOBAR_AA34836 [Gossypium barbadense]
MSLKEAHESFSSISRGPNRKERRLQIEELDEWFSTETRPTTRDCLGLCEHRATILPNTSYDKMPRPCYMAMVKPAKTTLVYDTSVWKNHTADPHIVTTTLNEEIPLTVISIFPFGTVEVSHPKFGTFKVNNTRLKPYFDEINSRNEEYKTSQTTMIIQRRYTMSSSRGKKATVPASKKRKGASSSSGPTVELTYLEITMELCSTFHLQTVMMNYDDLGMVQFRLSGLVSQLSIPEFGTVLGLYTEEFKEENDLHALNCHIHHYPLQCWDALVPGGATYNPSLSKAWALPPSLRYLHAILAHTITGWQESTSIVNTHDAYFLWCMLHRRSGLGRGLSLLAPKLLSWLTLRAPQHHSPRIILNPHWLDVSTRHLEHA